MIVSINELTTVNGAVNSNDNLGKVFLFFENTEGKDTMVHTNPRETFYISNFERRSRSAKFSFFKRSISCRRPMFCNVQEYACYSFYINNVFAVVLLVKRI